MNVTLRQPMSVEQFLAWKERQELRFEFDGVGPVAMVGGTAAHSTIRTNLIGALAAALKGTSCRVHGSHFKIAPAARIRYPDAFVVCSPQPADATIAVDPVVVFGISSPSTAHIDMIVKNAEYRDTPSIARYVVLEQSAPAALMFSRRGEDWVAETVQGADGSLHLPEIDVVLAMAELHDGVAAE